MSARAGALALLVVLPGLALAQPNPLAQGMPPRPIEPPAPRDPSPPQTPAWIGAFSDGEVRVELRPADRGFAGTISVSGTPYAAAGTVLVAGGVTRLEGRFEVGAREYDFSVEVLDDDTVVLESAGARHRLHREVVPRVDGPDVPDISHVRPGQTWVFQLEDGSELRWFVGEVSFESVQYDAQVWRDGPEGFAPVGPATSEEFTFAFIPATSGGVRRERVIVSGVPLDCVVQDDEDGARWIAVSGDMAVFPGCVRWVQGGLPALELLRIDQP